MPPSHSKPAGTSTGGRRDAVTQPLTALDEPFLGDLDEAEAPPIRGKVHPSAELSDAIPTLDDEVRQFRHHPNESGSIEFEVDPYAGDAAADLASDLGSEFLEGATRGQDMSELLMSHDDEVSDESFLYDDELVATGADEEEEGDLAEGLPADDEAESERRPIDREMQGGSRAGQTQLRNVAGDNRRR